MSKRKDWLGIPPDERDFWRDPPRAARVIDVSPRKPLNPIKRIEQTSWPGIGVLILKLWFWIGFSIFLWIAGNIVWVLIFGGG